MMYYVYAYLDPRKPGHYEYQTVSFLYEPFYVGKGSGYRMNKHRILAKKETSHMAHRIQDIWKESSQPIVMKLFANLAEEEALRQEVSLISEIGRRDLNTGPLLNKSAGGEKGIPYKWNRERKDKWLEKTLPKLKGSHTISEENQVKMQEGCKVFWNDPVRRRKHCELLSERSPKYWLGKTKTQQERINQSRSRKGIPATPEAIEKRASALRGKHRIARIPVTINGVSYPSVTAACKSTGLFRSQVMEMISC